MWLSARMGGGLIGGYWGRTDSGAEGMVLRPEGGNPSGCRSRRRGGYDSRDAICTFRIARVSENIITSETIKGHTIERGSHGVAHAMRTSQHRILQMARMRATTAILCQNTFCWRILRLAIICRMPLAKKTVAEVKTAATKYMSPGFGSASFGPRITRARPRRPANAPRMEHPMPLMQR